MITISLFIADRVLWLRTERNLIDHASCVVAPQARACVPPAQVQRDEPIKAMTPVSAGGDGDTAQTTAPTPAPIGTTTVVFGSFSDEERALAEWRRLQNAYAFMPRGDPVITPWQITNSTDPRILYRLESDAMSVQLADRLCRRIQLAGDSCSTRR